jgi:hypothetical protein
LHPKAPKNKKTKKGELKLPPLSSLLTMAGNKASPTNYAHKYQKVQKGESNFPVLSYLIYKFTTCVTDGRLGLARQKGDSDEKEGNFFP